MKHSFREETLLLSVFVAIFAAAVQFLPAMASSDLVLENAKITKVSGETITAKLNGKKYYVDTSEANFFRNDGKKASLDEMKKGDHINVLGEKDGSEDVSADSVTNTSIWELEDWLQGRIKKVGRNRQILEIGTSDRGKVSVYVTDNTTIRDKNGKIKKFSYLHKKYTVKVKGLIDGARKTVYETDNLKVVSKK